MKQLMMAVALVLFPLLAAAVIAFAIRSTSPASDGYSMPGDVLVSAPAVHLSGRLVR
jgi:hypothetical protein